jgi:hypothetical protein
MAKSDWLTTAEICERLGISRNHLCSLRDEGLLKHKIHWRDMRGSNAKRATYRWHLAKCEKAIDER